MPERDPRHPVASSSGASCPVRGGRILHPAHVNDVVDVGALVEIGCSTDSATRKASRITSLAYRA